MGIQSWSNRWLNRLYKLIAILLVVIAVLMSAIRLLLPYADNYRNQLQSYVNQNYQSNITIGSLTTGWQRFGPTLVAKNVSLFDSDSVKIFIEEVNIHIDFWGSISQRRLKTSDFTLVGAKIKLDKTLFDSDQAVQADATNFTGLSQLFLDQVERFTVKKSQLFVQDYHHVNRRFLIRQLAWLNEGERHRASGDVEVDGFTTNTLKLLLDVSGSGIAELQGQLYLSGENINITPWLGNFTDIDTTHAQTDINFQSWLAIDQGRPVRFLVDLGHNAIEWQQAATNHKLLLSQGQFMWQKNTNNNQSYLQSSPLQIQYDDELWPLFTTQFYSDPSQQYLYISNLQLTHLAQLYPIIETDSDKITLVSERQLTGSLTDIFLKKHNKRWLAEAKFSELGWLYGENIPGVASLSGQFLLNDSLMQLTVNSEQQNIDFGPLFDRPVPYQQLSALVKVKVLPEQWRVDVNDIELNSNELSLVGNFNLSQFGDNDINIALLAELKNVTATAAQHYYPLTVMDKDLVNYLNSAIIDGVVSEATVILNGALDAFPFANNEGVFVVDADLTDAIFQFAPDWPQIKEFYANLNFTNQQMTITGLSGWLKDVDVHGVVAHIPNLAENAELQVNATFNQHPRAITDLMLASPLKTTVGKTLQQLIVSGEVSGEFSLNVPLNHSENTVAQGRVLFNNNEVDLTSPVMTFSKVNGELFFNNDKLSSKNLTFQWLQLPMSVVVTAQAEKTQYRTSLALDAHWPETNWRAKLTPELAKYIDGHLNWQAKVELLNKDDGDFSYTVSAGSEFLNNSFNLPMPYQKLTGVSTPITISVIGGIERSIIEAKYLDNLHFYGELEHQNQHFSKAHLVLGKEQMLLPVAGFYISAEIEQAAFEPWFNLVNDILVGTQSADVNTTTAPLFDIPKRIHGKIGELTGFNESLTNVALDLDYLPDWWQLQLTAKEARTQVKFYHHWQQLGVEVNADFLALGDVPQPVLNGEIDANTETPAAEKIVKPVEPVMTMQEANAFYDAMVPIRFSCTQCQYGAINFGELSFQVNKTEANKLSLSSFRAQHNGSSLHFSGDWQLNQATHQTQLVGRLISKDIEHDLKSMGYDSNIRDSGLNLSFDVNWQGGLQDFDLSRLNGQINSRLDDGYIADVNDKGVRLLSVLSLKSLVRKLSLDFRDIFSKGMFFDEIKGDLTIQKGVMYTDNLAMDGTAGDLTIVGNTDLVSGKLDYRMAFVPKVTSSLPLIMAWMTANPVIGLAALAVDGVIQSTEVIAKINYELTGTVDEPIFKEVDRKNRDITVGQGKPSQIVESDNLHEIDPTIRKIKKPADQTKTIEQQEDKSDG